MSIFITHLVPQNLCTKIKGMSQAGLNFCYSFIEEIDPECTYALLITSEIKNHQFNFNNYKIIPIQVRFFKHIGILKLVNILFENLKLIALILRKKQRNIWFYNMTTHIWLVFILLKLFNKRCFVILADLSPDSLSSSITVRLLFKADGIIALSPFAQNQFIKHKNFHILSGIVNKSLIDSEMELNYCSSNFLFSGVLEEFTGIDLCLETFAELPEINLYISGICRNDDKIKRYSNLYPNIHYVGFVEYSEYLNLLKNCNFVLNLRNPKFSENYFNFPSKVIDYMALGKIIISTFYYPNIPQNLYFYCDYSKDSLRIMVEKIIKISPDLLSSLNADLKSYVNSEFNGLIWKKLIKTVENN
jgi:glycosyltransferase involved in cell wall biosynthesis